MRLEFSTKGIAEMLEVVRIARSRYSRVLKEEAQRFGDEEAERLKAQLWANGFGVPPKAREDGKPPLIDSAKYVNGYIAVVQGTTLSLFSQGMNDHMSNEALGEVLEYGSFPSPPRPHLRPFALQMESREGIIADRVFARLW